MELDYFKLYLIRYLKEHDFDQSALLSSVVTTNAELANDEFVNMRKAGYSYDGAKELAIKTLFVAIGNSTYETAADFLEDNFMDRVMYNGYDSFYEWTRKVSQADSIWKDYLIEGGLGLDEELVDNHRYELIYEIHQFLTKNGI